MLTLKENMMREYTYIIGIPIVNVGRCHEQQHVPDTCNLYS